MDNAGHIPVETAEPAMDDAVAGLVENAPCNDDRSQQMDVSTVSTMPVESALRTWADVELDVACALWAGDVDPANVHPSIAAWAMKKVSRRDEDVIAWGLALRKVDNALSYGRDFVIDLVRERPDGVDLVRNSAAMDQHVAGFVCEFGSMYVKSAPAADNARDNLNADDEAWRTGAIARVNMAVALALCSDTVDVNAPDFATVDLATLKMQRRDEDFVGWSEGFSKTTGGFTFAPDRVAECIRSADRDI